LPPEIAKNDSPEVSLAQTSGPDFGEGSTNTEFSNRAIAFSLLAFMGVLAMGFLWYAWETQGIRREHDEKLPKSQSITIPVGIAIACNVYIVALMFAVFRPRNRPSALRLTILLAGTTAVVVTIGLLRVHIRVSSDPSAAEDIFVQPVVRSVRPSDLTGLGYLPDDTNVIAAVNVAELRQTPAGREFLTDNGGKLWNWQRLHDWIGIDLTEIDHLIVGLKVDNNLLPRLMLIVETIHAFRVDEMRVNLKASKWPDPEACLFPSDRTMILALAKKDLERVSTERSEGIDQLGLPMQQALKERIPRDAQVWLVGHGDSWLKTPALSFLPGFTKENEAIVQRIQTLAVDFRLEKEPTVDAAFQCPDEASAKSLEQFLREHDSADLRDRKISQKENWVSFQAKVADISSFANRMRSTNLRSP
jgi:hypothetical protein